MLVGLTVVGVLGLLVGLGDVRVTALSWGERGASGGLVREDIRGRIDLFDGGVVHEVEVGFDQGDYEAMVATFRDEGAKEDIAARVTIDGTTIEPVGLRLKGTATLASLRRGGQGEDQDALPWLLSFDAFVDGRRYQGYEEIAVRPAGSIQAMLNESLALTLVAAAGEPAPRVGFARVVVNGGPAVLRLVVESPGDRYVADNFVDRGVLYKALNTGAFAYLGDDPLAYERAFRQITNRTEYDLAPLIDLLRWEAEATDEAFAAELADHVDVESLARYLALHDLLRNYDDMGGPGQNYYLWYDPESGRFTLLTWDMNLAFDPRFGGGAFHNALKARFLATPAFLATYDRARDELNAAVFADGRAVAELERLAALMLASGLVDLVEAEAAVAALRDVSERP
jgi:spore coat protein CotH